MVFSIFTELYKHLHYLIPEHFYQPNKKAVTPNFPFLYLLATTNLLSVFMDLPILDFHTNGIIQYVAFCVWLLSLSLFSGFFHVKACISTSFLFMAE